MNLKYCVSFLLMVGIWGCDHETNQRTAQASSGVVPPGRTLPSAPEALAATGSLMLMDSLGLCYHLVAEKTLPAFVKHQRLAFQVAADTVIDDERGRFVGTRLSAGRSFLQWLDDSTLTRLDVTDPRVVFQHGIRVGMSKPALAAVLGVRPFAADTVSLDSGYLDNFCDFYFQQGALHRIVLVNLPD